MAQFDYSFEFFPPKTELAGTRLDAALDVLQSYDPSFVSITYGAGGTTRERTFKTVRRILKNRPVTPATHLTCVNASREEIDVIVQEYLDLGVNHFVALRGDPPGAVDGIYSPRADGYAYGSDLVSGIRKRSNDAIISVSAYPERHPESGDWDTELDNLKRKIDAGADQAITQFFFEPETFLKFRDRVSAAGLDIPIIPGIMLQPNFKGLQKMSDMCGVAVPFELSRKYDKAGDDTKQRERIATDYATRQVLGLLDGGVKQFHFYTLNAAPIAVEVIENVKGGSSVTKRANG